jgi:Sigma-54 interaction domain
MKVTRGVVTGEAAMIGEHGEGNAQDKDWPADVKLVELSGVALVQGAPEPALDVARIIAAECGGDCSSLFVVDCDRLSEWQMAFAMGWYLSDASRGRMPNSLVLFREVHVLTQWNQTQLAELLSIRRRGRDSVRVAASSSVDLFELVCDEQFDDTLYYLLNVVTLKLPGSHRESRNRQTDTALGVGER